MNLIKNMFSSHFIRQNEKEKYLFSSQLFFITVMTFFFFFFYAKYLSFDFEVKFLDLDMFFSGFVRFTLEMRGWLSKN